VENSKWHRNNTEIIRVALKIDGDKEIARVDWDARVLAKPSVRKMPRTLPL
jgi:hypothetical protein